VIGFADRDVKIAGWKGLMANDQLPATSPRARLLNAKMKSHQNNWEN